jgi:anti-sigma factor ChrR (cupin superfamily)
MGCGIVITCREVSTLVAGDALAASPWRRRLAVRLHLMMCAACRQFARQIDAIQRGAASAGHLFDGEAPDLEARLAERMSRGKDA